MLKPGLIYPPNCSYPDFSLQSLIFVVSFGAKDNSQSISDVSAVVHKDNEICC